MELKLDLLCIFTLFASEILFGFRILNDLKHKNLIQKSEMTKIGTTIFVFLLVMNGFILPTITFGVVWGLLLFAIILLTSESLVRWWRNKCFEENFGEFLNTVLIEMTGGSGFRAAITKTQEGCDVFMQHQIQRVMDIVVFSPQTKAKPSVKFIDQVVYEFQQADFCVHQARRRLENFRHRLKMRKSFRRRSWQMIQQTRVQSCVLSLFYLVLLVVVLKSSSLQTNVQSVVVSLLMFAGGTFWLLKMGNKKKWNV